MEKVEVTAPEMKGGEARGQSSESMSELLDGGYGGLPPKRGDAVEGTIVRIRPTEILVDVGYKSEGIVTARDLDRLSPDYLKALKVGDKILAYVLHPENRNGDMILSLSRALMERDWQEASRLFEAEEILEKPVAGFNRGGVIVNLGRVRGFVPASQIASARLGRGMDDAEREAILSQLVGRQLKLKVIEMDRRRNRLILSERAAQREWREEQKARLLTELREGEVRHGVVSSLCDFGAFVDLGGADGLVHLSELAWRRVRHPREVLSLGQEVDVYVLGVDRERRRIALSLKRLEKEPWSQVEQKYEDGQLITCTVTKLTDFGAFARLDEDIEGLVHISELSDERIEHPSEVLEEGQEVTLRIIRIDVSRQRIGLSLRRAQEEKVPEHDLGESEETQELEDLSEETGELEGLPVETREVEDLPVETRELEDLPVETGEVEDLSVETGEVEDLPVETGEVEDLPVETKELEDLPVETGEVEDLLEETGEPEDLSVETGELEDLSVETGEVEDLSVETGEVEDLPVETGEVEDLPVETGEVEDLSVETGEVEDLPEETGELEDLPEETRELEDLPEETGEVEDLPGETREVEDLSEETREAEDLSEEDEAGRTADTGRPSEDVSTLVGD